MHCHSEQSEESICSILVVIHFLWMDISPYGLNMTNFLSFWTTCYFDYFILQEIFTTVISIASKRLRWIVLSCEKSSCNAIRFLPTITVEMTEEHRHSERSEESICSILSFKQPSFSQWIFHPYRLNMTQHRLSIQNNQKQQLLSIHIQCFCKRICSWR